MKSSPEEKKEPQSGNKKGADLLIFDPLRGLQTVSQYKVDGRF